MKLHSKRETKTMEKRQKQEKDCLKDKRSLSNVSIPAVFKALCMTGMEDTAVNILIYKTEKLHGTKAAHNCLLSHFGVLQEN